MVQYGKVADLREEDYVCYDERQSAKGSLDQSREPNYTLENNKIPRGYHR